MSERAKQAGGRIAPFTIAKIVPSRDLVPVPLSAPPPQPLLKSPRPLPLPLSPPSPSLSPHFRLTTGLRVSEKAYEHSVNAPHRHEHTLGEDQQQLVCLLTGSRWCLLSLLLHSLSSASPPSSYQLIGFPIAQLSSQMAEGHGWRPRSVIVDNNANA